MGFKCGMVETGTIENGCVVLLAWFGIDMSQWFEEPFNLSLSSTHEQMHRRVAPSAFYSCSSQQS